MLIYDDETSIKCNGVFLQYFGRVIKSEKIHHHSQMLTEITNPDKLLFEFYQGGWIEKISLLDVIRKQKEMNQKELILWKEGGDKIFMFTFYRLENIYNSKTVWIFKDTTHIHQLQKVKSQVEFRSVIMGCLTHELRTPVNWVLSILKSLSDYIQDSDEARKLLMICQGTIEMLRSLTEDFIDFTRFENEKGLPIKKENIDIKDFFGDIENIFGFQAEEKNLRFDINMTPDVPETIHTDPKRLKQVLLNLLSNAFKFTQRGKIEINLNVKSDIVKQRQDFFTLDSYYDMTKSLLKGSLIDTQQLKDENKNFKWIDDEIYYTQENDLRRFLWIEVIDTGLGIDEKDRRELFTKFGTGKNNRGLNTNGLGLGLYLSKEIWKKLGGDINWESIIGIGSTFIIKLPFDEVFEIKQILSRRTFHWRGLSLQRKKNFVNFNLADFSEFFDSETRDSNLNFIDYKYDLKIAKNIFGWITESHPNPFVSPPSVDEIKEVKSFASSSFEKRGSECKYELDIIKTCNCKKVLIVDDLAFNLLAVELMLKKKFGILPDKAFSGDDSIIKVKQKLMSPCWKSYSLILMDYYMPPGINGAEASLKIKQILKHNSQKSFIAWLTSQREGDFAFNKSLKKILIISIQSQ